MGSSADQTPLSRRLVIPCWTHEEIVALIDAYREKWYDLRRGNLRAKHWQEVADAVKSKTAVQCRHKIEKLRQRYRAERRRLAIKANSGKPRVSSWVYFRKMDSLEMETSIPPSSSPSGDGKDNVRRRIGGAANVSVPGGFRPKAPLNSFEIGAAIPPHSSSSGDAKDDFRQRRAVNSTVPGGFRPNAPMDRDKKPKLRLDGEGKKRKSAIWEMVSAVEMLGEEFSRIEERKMEMIRDMEKARREMELKRMKMIVDSQRQISDFIRSLLGNGGQIEPKKEF